MCRGAVDIECRVGGTSDGGGMLVLLLIFAMLLPAASRANNLWQDNVLGIWFDEEMETSCVSTTGMLQDVVGYVYIRHIPAYLITYELNMTIGGDENILDMQVTLMCGFNIAESDRDYLVMECWHAPGPGIHLLTFVATIIHPDIPVYFYLRAFSSPWWEPYPECIDTPCYSSSVDEVHSLIPSSGSTDLPVAAINDGQPCSVVGDSSQSWGAVKMLYR